VRVADLHAGATGSTPLALTNVNGTLYFAADDGVNGWSLWQTTGTVAGTSAVSPSVAGNAPLALRMVDGTLYGTAGGLSLWRLTPAADHIGPTVIGSAFVTQGVAECVVLEFSEDVSASLAAADLTLTPRTGVGVSVTPSAVNYDALTNTATFTFANLSGGRLPDGDYRATLAADGVTDRSANRLDGNADGTAGDDFHLDLFALAGDANRDRTVDFNDLVRLAQNYNAAGGMTAAEGDFNYDGRVDFSDLVLLAQRYNTAVAPAAVPDGAAAAAPSTFAADWAAANDAPVGPVERSRRQSLFATVPIVTRIPSKPHAPARRNP